ncbi:ALOX8 lipoxygenase, partial [Geococcyx californianus]|nr:ALOX8 lipoxygenase [Geococcyx californianus]
THGCSSLPCPPPPPGASYVSGIVALYYPDEASVGDDPEVQNWVLDIFTNGFLGRSSSGTGQVGV